MPTPWCVDTKRAPDARGGASLTMHSGESRKWKETWVAVARGGALDREKLTRHLEGRPDASMRYRDVGWNRNHRAQISAPPPHVRCIKAVAGTRNSESASLLQRGHVGGRSSGIEIRMTAAAVTRRAHQSGGRIAKLGTRTVRVRRGHTEVV